MRRVAGVVAAVVLCGVAGCGPGDGEAEPSHGEAEPSRSAAPVPSEAFVLRSDGTVPWVDEPISDDQVYGTPRAPRTARPGAGPCQAAQLAGRLEEWTGPTGGGEEPRGGDAVGDKLFGYVEVRNTSGQDCTLQGEVPTRLLAGGREVPLLYVHDINEEAQRRVIVVPADERANLRVDWSGPFCEEIRGPLELVIELPNGGGTLRAPITPTKTPACTGGEAVDPNIRGTLYASGFSEPGQAVAPHNSPLKGVTIAVTGPRAARPGERVTYHVVMANPTAAPIPLDPCPAYGVALFSRGDAVNEAVNTGQLYRLNCRPVSQVPPGGRIRFEMVVRVPAELTAGRELTVTWRLAARDFVQGPTHWGHVTMRIG